MSRNRSLCLATLLPIKWLLHMGVAKPHCATSNFWLERDGQVVLSEWRVALLEAVADTGSISAAAARQGVHFRVAWRKLQEMEARLGTKLTERTTGGPRGGGTRLTPEGLDCVRRFRQVTAGLQDLIAQRCAEAFEAS
jgi:molybdate transport system regulatory protein